MEITPEKCMDKYVQTESIEYRQCEVNANAKRIISRALREWRQLRHMERKVGVYASVLRQLEAGKRIRRQRIQRPKSDVRVSGLEHPWAQNTIHGDRTAGCKSHLQMIGKRKPVLRNGQRKARRRMRGMQCPRRAVLEACLDRCTGRRWIHHAASGKDLDRQSPRKDSRWHSYPTLPWWLRGEIFVARSRALRRRKVARDYECGLNQ